jgi:hypothetical protein
VRLVRGTFRILRCTLRATWRPTILLWALHDWQLAESMRRAPAVAHNYGMHSVAGTLARTHCRPFSERSVMRAQALRWSSYFVLLSSLTLSSTLAAQPPRSGGFDLTYGIGSSTGGEYKDRSGTLNSIELLFSTRMDGGNTPLLLGAQAIYFAADDGDNSCVPSEIIVGCVRKFPDVAGGGLLLAYEPTFLANTFFHINGGIAVVQPSSDGGPTIGLLGAARLGQSIGRHLAILVGGRVLSVPNMRGDAVHIPAFSFGIRIR